QYFNADTVKFNHPSDYTPKITKYAQHALKKIFKNGIKYKKAGVCLLGIVPKKGVQYDFFSRPKDLDSQKKNRIMKSIDQINQIWGRNTIKLGILGVSPKWTMKRQMLSKRFTTCWDELLTI
ncbi:MAG: DUF4113 domain-containing protein, partial [Patescibacteria group bacterium]|nr:DUF4113 domain-containing protein [Patescibacteria group bacterium]